MDPQELHLFNIQAEQNTLGIFLQEPEKLKDTILKPEHFGEEIHRNLMHTLLDLDEKGKPINFVSIVERVGNTRVEKIGGVSYLTKMAGAIATATDFEFHQSVVLEYYQKRQQYEIGKRIMQSVYDEDAAAARQAAIEDLNGLDDFETDEDDIERASIKNILLRVNDWMEQDHGAISGAPTGFKELDNTLSGLQRKDLVIIGARPSMGKTAFANGILTNYTSGQFGKSGPGALFSLEMPDEGIAKRMISSEGNLDAGRMRNPLKQFLDEDWTKSSHATGALYNRDLYIFDKSSQNVPYIKRQLRKLKRKHPGEHLIAVIDYLQLIQGDPKHGGNRQAEINEISRQLKGVARELDLTIVALSQLNRSVESRQDKRPMMSDLRDSGGIEQDADVIGFLYRDDYYYQDSESKGIVEVIIAKQRNGPIGTVQLAFVKEYSKFINLERRYDK